MDNACNWIRAQTHVSLVWPCLLSTPSPFSLISIMPVSLDHPGVHPQTLIGKVLIRARRSPRHPSLTLDFRDNTAFQILVDGYDPAHPGVPKELEFDPLFDHILAKGESLDLTVVDCAFVTLSDKAFQRKHNPDGDRRVNDLRWDQKHLGLAFRFSEEKPRWHCVWAMLEDHDKEQGTCIFRSYGDVYLQRLHRSPRKPRKRLSLAQHVQDDGT
ncbi:hypothetical protein ARMGADRAFT_1166279 [Armillaria gallica]|uniref:Uncharacterized protein n=1 Tax=Armillaria gallica TaxID=47427 RepID=A0A2H3DKS2_ARMGA|nr:hypothetical protein ARMGADRAFT_1166279 [Armillaria gallica]